jgi:hypothetical protein
MSILRGENKKTSVIAIFSSHADGPKRAVEESCGNNEGAHRGIPRLRSVRFTPCSALEMM